MNSYKKDIYIYITIRRAFRPRGVLDHKGARRVVYLIPPLPPQWVIRATNVHRQCVPWSIGRSIFRSFLRFDFELNFDIVLTPI